MFEELPVDDPKIRCPNISKAKKKLEPKVKLNEGIKKTIEFFKSKKD